MQPRSLARFLTIALLLAAALPAAAQSLRVPQRPEPGIDPSLARGWLAPTYDRYGFARFQWKDAVGFAPSSRMNWSYAFGERGSLGMSYANGSYDPAADGRQYGLFGRYSFNPDWSVSAEALSNQPGALFRLQDFRIGFQRRF
ncbi:MAG TPA: hypothetical protein VHL85_06995 [Burkholderiales bacterium]|jgi:hypothetical protein|nr:hypothetical protein [Burkholderiales bacterium]